MSTLTPFTISFFLPGLGQLILKDYLKGSIILLGNIILTLLILNLGFLNFIPFWAPHFVFMTWAIFDIYDKVEKRYGKKPAIRNLVLSVVISVLLIPLALYLFTYGLYKGTEFFVDKHLNEGRTKEEMNEISTQLELYKNHHGYYPKNYKTFTQQKPIWASWKADSWKNPYKYELIDSLNYRLISAGEDGIYFSEDDIIISN